MESGVIKLADIRVVKLAEGTRAGSPDDVRCVLPIENGVGGQLSFIRAITCRPCGQAPAGAERDGQC